MIERSTPYGRLLIGAKSGLFATAVELAGTAHRTRPGARFTWALTGGTTPDEFYDWCVATRALPPALVGETDWCVSDERQVLPASAQSNWGNAERRLLGPLGVPAAHRHPWNTTLGPRESAREFGRAMAALNGPERAFDLCFLGLGADAHTASLFPGSPLLAEAGSGTGCGLFTALDTSKGWRLTITPAGLRACGNIVVMALGEGKAPALKRVFTDSADPVRTPAQILQTCAGRVTWLVDAAAAGLLPQSQ